MAFGGTISASLTFYYTINYRAIAYGNFLGGNTVQRQYGTI